MESFEPVIEEEVEYKSVEEAVERNQLPCCGTDDEEHRYQGNERNESHTVGRNEAGKGDRME
ncbi:hypothetical protein SDC9_148250 [bioreactor metagenome]|uniref:Uncharacterized protein n=1 Tax=bioreactor metagenome TaxID=1076179 RepID=A0A645EIA1_9ZZZZ